MKRIAIMMVVAVVVLGQVNAASASVWVDRDPWNIKLTHNGSTEYKQSEFNIVTLDTGAAAWAGDIAGFVVGTDIVANATVTIRAKDDSCLDLWEEIKVKLGGLTIGSHIEVNFTPTILSFPVSASLIGDINADGKLIYKVVATKGDFILEYAELCADDISHSGSEIPEPATFIIWSLLGAGSWMGMRVWRRRGSEVGPVSRQPWSPESRQAIHDIISRS